MQKILFYITNEFHLMIAGSLILEKFADPLEYEVTMVQGMRNDNKRFNQPLNVGVLGVKYVVLKLEDENVKTVLKQLVAGHIHRYVAFLEQSPVNLFFSQTLSRKGTLVCLAPDGTKPYLSFTKSALPSRIISTWQSYKYLWSKGIYNIMPQLNSNTYAYLPETKEVWINHPGTFLNRTKKKVVPINILPNENIVRSICSVFNFDANSDAYEKDGVIFCLNHWVNNPAIYPYEIELLKSITEKYPAKKLYIKLHPLTPEKQLEAFEKLGNVHLIRSGTPAELYIATLKNAIVFSFWSASLLVNNPSCKFYWLHTMLRKEGLMQDWFKVVNPSSHIKEIVDIRELEF